MRVLSGKRAWLECVVLLRITGLLMAVFAAVAATRGLAEFCRHVSEDSPHVVFLAPVPAQARSEPGVAGEMRAFGAALWKALTSGDVWTRVVVFRSTPAFLVHAAVGIFLLSPAALPMARRLTLWGGAAHG